MLIKISKEDSEKVKLILENLVVTTIPLILILI